MAVPAKCSQNYCLFPGLLSLEGFADSDRDCVGWFRSRNYPLGGCTTLISTILTRLGCAVQLEALAVGSVQ